jgi:protein-disulfide isomerase
MELLLMQRTHLISFLSLLFLTFSSFNAYAQSAQDLFHLQGDITDGNPNGSVTMVEFFNYQCEGCLSMIPVVQSIIKANPELRVVYKLIPLHGPESVQATRAGLAANMQGKFTPFNHALLSTTNELKDPFIFSLAKANGLDVNKLKQDMQSDLVNNNLNTNIGLVRELKIPATPAFIFGKTNATDFSNILTIIGAINERALQSSINAAGQ